MKVSVITISQHGRFPLLQLLLQHIQKQTVQTDEWVIVEGSKTPEDAALHKENIATLVATFPIRYLPYDGPVKLGGLRNRGNKACKGDIIICMDDDDYYPIDRIHHVLEQFRKYPNINIAGCSNVLLYDYSSKKLYQCVGFHGNHSTNNAMAWRSSYLTYHQHDDSKSNAEEASFTNSFSEKMIPLHPLKTVIVSSHTINTFDKRSLIESNPRFMLLPHSALYTIMPEAVHKIYSDFFEMKRQ